MMTELQALQRMPIVFVTTINDNTSAVVIYYYQTILTWITQHTKL